MSDNLAEIKIGEISKILAEMVKTVKIVSIYPDNNPLPTKLKESFIDRFTDLIRDYGELRFSIKRNKIFYGGEVVFSDKPDSDEESLAELLYNNGLTEFLFRPSFGSHEANHFFKAMKSFLNREEGSGDLVSLLWQENINGFEYSVVDDYDLKEYDREFLIHDRVDEDDDQWFMSQSNNNDVDEQIEYSKIFLEDDESEGKDPDDITAEEKEGLGPVPKKCNTQPTDNTQILQDAYTLEDTDKEQTKMLLEEDSIFDMHKSTTDLLIEILAHESEYSGFFETIAMIEKLNSQFLAAGELQHSSNLLEVLNQFSQSIPDTRPKWKERIHSALIMSGGYEGMTTFAESLNNDSSIGANEIHQYLSNFGWEAVSSITDLLGVLEHKDHRLAVCNYLIEHGKNHVELISKGIFDKRWFVVRNTVAIMVGIGGKKAYSYLEKAISHEEPRVRENMAKSLKEYKDPESLNILTKLVFDSNRQVQKIALDAVFECDRELQLNSIADIIKDTRFSEMRDPDWGKIIMRYSELEGENAVKFLADLVSEWKAFPNKSDIDRRQTVFNALIVNKSEKAERLLQSMSKSWRSFTRKAAKEALSKRKGYFEKMK